MFAQAWSELGEASERLGPRPANHRRALLQEAETFFDFAATDLARHKLMNQRTIPDFTPERQGLRGVRDPLRADAGGAAPMRGVRRQLQRLVDM